MNYMFHFKTIDRSEALCEFTADKFSRLDRFEIKPMTVHVTFSQEKTSATCSVFIKGMKSPLRTEASAENLFEAVEMVTKKLFRILEKQKSIVKFHKHKKRKPLVREAA